MRGLLLIFLITIAVFFPSQGKDEPRQITVLAVGDIMLDRGVEYMVKKAGNNNYYWPFLKISNYIRSADIAFGNLECPISNKGIRVGSIYSFRADPKFVKALKWAGFDIVSLANNHALDYGKVALRQTMELLKDNNIDYVGAGNNLQEALSLKVKEIKGVRIGFLAYTNLGPKMWSKAGMAWINNLDGLENYIKEKKKLVDVLIVSLHAGEEYKVNPTLFQINFAKTCIKAGADLIIGHHPHVIQKVERYKNGWIAYSLGNFVFDQSFSEKTMEGLVLKVIIENKKIKEVLKEKIKINNYFQPYLYEE